MDQRAIETETIRWMRDVQNIINNSRIGNHANLSKPVISMTKGKKYIKILRDTSAYAFISYENGDIFKAASWKAPAKHPRGNIFAEDKGMGCVELYGIHSLRY